MPNETAIVRRKPTRPIIRIVAWSFGGYFVLNLLYAAKSLMGMDFLPGHHGALFPLGDAIFERLRVHPKPLSFEGPYVNATSEGDRGQAAGQIASNWADSSTWSPVKVIYDRVSAGGTSSGSIQSVEIRDLASGGRWQMVQNIGPLLKGNYQLTATVRAEESMHLGLALQQPGKPWQIYFSKDFLVRPQWTTIRLVGRYDAPVGDHGVARFMIRSGDQGRVLLRGASLTRISSGPTRVISPG